jgi:hypothetical protein
MSKSDSPRTNALLAALPVAVFKRLKPSLEAVQLEVGETLFRQSGKLQFAYFPTDSIVTLSYAVAANGAMAKAWPVGREGVVGISLFLGSPKRENRADVQIGGLAYRLPAEVMSAEFRRGGEMQRLLLRYVFALVTQASQLSICNAYHATDRRLGRFLLRIFDRVSTPEVAITQDRISALLGVRRVSITQAAGQLQAAGIIEYRRGHIKLVDEKKLEERSCACAGLIRRAFAAVSA